VKKAELYYEFLQAEGYVPHYDPDGDIVFKSEGMTFLLFASEDDEEYFRMSLPNFWPIESSEERQRVLAAACRVNAELKVVKVYPVDDNVWASVELLFGSPEEFKPVFGRALRVIRHGVDHFAKVMSASLQ